MLELRKSQDRGTGRQDWLEARFTFSFGPYQDPKQNGFSDLKLLNDDRVAPGGGFATHSHQDMEVFSYVLAGALEHKDSMGEGSVVRAGEVIAMSTGSGITHSEYNHSKSERVHFFQIWIAPDRHGGEPRYQQKHFADVEKRGHLRLLLSPDGTDGSLAIYQDARVYAGLFDGKENFGLAQGADRCAYVHVVRGSVFLNDIYLTEGDGVRVCNERRLVFDKGRDAEVLVFDLCAVELNES